MTDLEQQLADALTDGARGAPSAVGLAGAARSRARSRRRHRVAGAAAVVALCVGVPTAVVVAGGSDDDSRPSDGTVATDPAPPGRTLPAGFHYESWHDVTIEVPDSWQYGGATDWCVDEGSLATPRISRPGPVLSIGCTPAQGYGVSFQPLDDNDDDFYWPLTKQNPETWPADAYVGAHGLGGVLVEIALPDLNLAQQILASARVNTSLDPHGCPVDATSDPVVPADSMSVCRYDGAGQLEQSELLTGAEVADAEKALHDAPAGETRGCTADLRSDQQLIRMSSLSEDAEVDLKCGWLTQHGETRALTPDVLYWALSPGWSGSVPDGVSLPSELRRR